MCRNYDKLVSRSCEYFPAILQNGVNRNKVGLTCVQLLRGLCKNQKLRECQTQLYGWWFPLMIASISIIILVQRPPTGSLLKAFTLAYVHSQIWLYMWNCIFFVDFCVRLSESTFMNPCSGQPFSLHVSSRLNQRILFELWQTHRLETRDHHNHRLAERLQKGFHQPSFLTIKCLSLCRWRPKMQTLQQSRTRKWWSKRCSADFKTEQKLTVRGYFFAYTWRCKAVSFCSRK